MKLYKMMFFNLMIIGTMISISSSSWFMMWMGLEINLLSLLPLMKNIKNKYSSESSIKYFIVQTMASSMFLFTIIIFSNKNFNFNLSMYSSLLIDSCLLLKIGAAPLHFWFPEIISGLNWKMIFIIMTWQKIAPMIMLTYTTLMPTFLSLIIIFSSMMSSIQNMNQTCLRKIMAYSSINHLSWMISAIMNSTLIWIYYFFIYTFINMNIIYIFFKYKIFFFNQLTKLFNENFYMKFMFMMNFLSLGGLPPFIGFFPKWLTINFLIFNKYFILPTILIIFTLISLYIYTRMLISTLTLSMNKSLMKSPNKISFMQFLMNFFLLTSLMLCNIPMNFF